MMIVVMSSLLSMAFASRDQVLASSGQTVASLDQAGGALSSAAVPRGGLGPPAPPLCRCAERTTDLISKRRWRLTGCTRTLVDSREVMNIQPLRVHHGRCPGAWGEWRSGIKEEAAALGRHGGQPRSQSPQVPGRTQAHTLTRTKRQTPWRIKTQAPGRTKIQTQEHSATPKAQKP